MASPFLLLEAVNLFCNDHDPDESKHLTLAEMKLPVMQKILEDHHPGGAPVGIEVELGMVKFTASFKLNGTDPKLLADFGLGSRDKNVFTSYGFLRDQHTGKTVSSKAIMRAGIGKIEGDTFKRGDLQGHDHELNAITRYELYIGGEEIYYWDFFASVFRTGGVDRNAELNRALRIG